MQLRVFLQQVSQRGPTVATASLPLSEVAATLRSFAQTPEGHVPQPAQPLSPEEMWTVVSFILERVRLTLAQHNC